MSTAFSTCKTEEQYFENKQTTTEIAAEVFDYKETSSIKKKLC